MNNKCVEKHTSRITAYHLETASAAGMDIELYMRKTVEDGAEQQAGRGWE